MDRRPGYASAGQLILPLSLAIRHRDTMSSTPFAWNHSRVSRAAVTPRAIVGPGVAACLHVRDATALNGQGPESWAGRNLCPPRRTDFASWLAHWASREAESRVPAPMIATIDHSSASPAVGSEDGFDSMKGSYGPGLT
jgi:hypothetical protein